MTCVLAPGLIAIYQSQDVYTLGILNTDQVVFAYTFIYSLANIICQTWEDWSNRKTRRSGRPRLYVCSKRVIKKLSRKLTFIDPFISKQQPKLAVLNQALCAVIIGGTHICYFVIEYSLHGDAVDGLMVCFIACTTIVHAAIGLRVAGQVKYERLHNRFPEFVIILVLKRYYNNIVTIWKQMQQNIVPEPSIYAMLLMFLYGLCGGSTAYCGGAHSNEIVPFGSQTESSDEGPIGESRFRNAGNSFRVFARESWSRLLNRSTDGATSAVEITNQVANPVTSTTSISDNQHNVSQIESTESAPGAAIRGPGSQSSIKTDPAASTASNPAALARVINEQSQFSVSPAVTAQNPEGDNGPKEDDGPEGDNGPKEDNGPKRDQDTSNFFAWMRQWIKHNTDRFKEFCYYLPSKLGEHITMTTGGGMVGYGFGRATSSSGLEGTLDSGTAMNANPAGEAEPSGSLVATNQKDPAGEAKPSGSLVETNQKDPAGEAKPSESLVETNQKDPAGEAKPSGSLVATNQTDPAAGTKDFGTLVNANPAGEAKPSESPVATNQTDPVVDQEKLETR